MEINIAVIKVNGVLVVAKTLKLVIWSKICHFT